MGEEPDCQYSRHEMWFRFLSWQDLLEEEMATHSQCPCLENPMERGAWWATAHSVAESQNMTEAT